MKSSFNVLVAMTTLLNLFYDENENEILVLSYCLGMSSELVLVVFIVFYD